MKIEIKNFTTWPNDLYKFSDIRAMLCRGLYIELTLDKSDFSLTDLMRIRDEFKNEIVEEKLFLEKPDSRTASCKISLQMEMEE